MIIKITEKDILKASKLLESNDIKYEVNFSEYRNWVSEFLIKSLNDFIDNPEVSISKIAKRNIYNKIPSMVVNIETEIFKSSFSSKEKSKITLLYHYIKEYCDVYIFDEILKEKYNNRE